MAIGALPASQSDKIGERGFAEELISSSTTWRGVIRITSLFSFSALTLKKRSTLVVRTRLLAVFPQADRSNVPFKGRSREPQCYLFPVPWIFIKQDTLIKYLRPPYLHTVLHKTVQGGIIEKRVNRIVFVHDIMPVPTNRCYTTWLGAPTRLYKNQSHDFSGYTLLESSGRGVPVVATTTVLVGFSFSTMAPAGVIAYNCPE